MPVRPEPPAVPSGAGSPAAPSGAGFPAVPLGAGFPATPDGAPPPRRALIVTIDRISGRTIREGGLVWAQVINASNILKDLREHLTNTLGGKMRNYEELQRRSMAEVLARLEAAALEQGYDGVVGMRIATSRIAEGASELIAYGTGFTFADAPPPPPDGA